MFFCKNFLSFSKNEETPKNFASNSSGNLVGCVYTLTIEDDSDYFNNIDVGDNSYFGEGEQEVLFFPFSCFTIDKIEEENDLKVLYIKYLSGVNEIVKNQVKNKPNDTSKKN